MDEAQWAPFLNSHIIVDEPLFLCGSVAQDCALFNGDRMDTTLELWMRYAVAIGLKKLVNDDVGRFSSGERTAAAILLLAAMIRSRSLAGCQLLLAGSSSSLSPARRDALRKILSETPLPISTISLSSDCSVRPW